MKTKIINNLDLMLAKSFGRIFPERNSLMTFLFHGLFLDKKESTSGFLDPQQGITVDEFRQFVEYYRKHNFVFVSPEEIIKGLEPDKKYILITFDDGYFNNHRALDLLKEYKLPAVFFISSGHLLENKSFWWDVIYRERKARGQLNNGIGRERLMLKKKTAADIDRYLIEEFGKNALKPKSDIDRPFTPEELKKFGAEKYVFLGNHTHDHAILTNYSSEGIRQQLRDCQDFLSSLTGEKPQIVSYPDGGSSDGVVRIAEEEGFKVGITVNPIKNYLPLNGKNGAIMQLGRFILSGEREIYSQNDIFRSDLAISNRVKSATGYKRG